MDDTLNQILHACKLARGLETNLGRLANHPLHLLSSCEDVADAFNNAIHMLHSHNHGTQMFFGGTSGSLLDMRAGSPLDIRAGEGSSHGVGYMQAINFSQGQLMEEDNPFHRCRTTEGQTITPEHLCLEFQTTSIPMAMVDTGRGSGGGGGDALAAAAEGSFLGERRPAGSSIQRSSRRR